MNINNDQTQSTQKKPEKAEKTDISLSNNNNNQQNQPQQQKGIIDPTKFRFPSISNSPLKQTNSKTSNNNRSAQIKYQEFIAPQSIASNLLRPTDINQMKKFPAMLQSTTSISNVQQLPSLQSASNPQNIQSMPSVVNGQNDLSFQYLNNPYDKLPSIHQDHCQSVSNQQSLPSNLQYYNDIYQQNNQLKKVNFEMKIEIDSLQKTSKDLRSTLASELSKNDCLFREKTLLNNQLNESNETINKLKEELFSLQCNINLLSRQQSLQMNAEKLKEMENNHQIFIEKMRNEHKKEMNEIAERTNELQKTSVDLRHRVDNLSKEKSEMEKRVNEKTKEIETMKQQHDKLMKEMKEMRSNSNNEKKELHLKQNEIIKLKKQVSDIEKQNETLRTSEKNQTEKIHQNDMKIKQLERQIDSLKKEKESLFKEKNDLTHFYHNELGKILNRMIDLNEQL